MNTGTTGKHLMNHHCLKKKSFYSELYIEYITDKDYLHAQEVFKES